MSAELYLRNTDKFYIVGDILTQLQGMDTFRLPSAVEPGQWAILIIQDYCDNRWEDKRQIRYALVSPTGNSKAPGIRFRVSDLPSYLETIVEGDPKIAGQARKLRKWWEETIDQTEKVYFYKEKDIHDILQKIYRPAKKTSSKPQGESSRSAGFGCLMAFGLSLVLLAVAWVVEKLA